MCDHMLVDANTSPWQTSIKNHGSNLPSASCVQLPVESMGDWHKAEFTIYSYSNQILIYFSCTMISKHWKGTLMVKRRCCIQIIAFIPKWHAAKNIGHALEYSAFWFWKWSHQSFQYRDRKSSLTITFIMHIKMLQCKQDRQDNTF